MSTIISLINVKGGVGKTMTAINLAGQIVKQDHSVLMLDNDSQSSLSQILNVKSEYNMYDLYNSPKVMFDDCITEYDCTLKHDKKIYVIPNTIESVGLESQTCRKRNKESILKEKYDKFNNKFDYIIIDNSPFLGVTLKNSLVMSNYYIEVIDNSTSALQGLNMVDMIINELKDTDLIDDLKLLGIIRNNFEKRTIFSRKFNGVVTEKLNDKMFKTIIYNSVKYKEATAMHKLIQAHSEKHSEPYKKLYDEILKRIK